METFDRPLSMSLRDVLWVHWPVDPGPLRAGLPAGLELDTHEGRAWLSVVALDVRDARPRLSPLGRSFRQVNLRTYVRDGDRTGVQFLSLDATDPAGVETARRLFDLPYYRASIDVRKRGERTVLRMRRTHPDAPGARFDAVYEPGEGRVADPLASFLTERYHLYATAPDARRTVHGELGHEPWSLRPVEVDVRTNTLPAAAGLPSPTDESRAHYCPGVEASAGLVRRAELSGARSNAGR